MYTTSSIIEKFKKIHNDKYDYSLVEYKNTRDNIEIICLEHGIFEQTPHSHIKNGCIKCKNKNNLIKRFNKIHNNKYDYSLMRYENRYSRIKIICPIHGIFHQVSNKHLKNGCKKCSDDKKRFTKQEFTKRAIETHGNKYDYSLIDYKSSHKKVKIVCPIHGIFEQKPYLHLNHRGCRKCDNINKSIRCRSNTEEFIKKSKSIHGNKYDYSLVEYGNNGFHKVKIICPIHGIFEQKPSYYKNGCPYCRNSRGEMEIMNILDNENIKYESEKRFYDCCNKIPLPFDFYLPEYNICIEYDGIQHFEPIKYWDGDKGFLYIKNNDKIKNKYCKNNNIKLIRIKYNNKTVYDTIKNELK